MTNKIQINVLMAEPGVELIDKERGQISRSEYIRQAVKWAIQHKFKPQQKDLL